MFFLRFEKNTLKKKKKEHTEEKKKKHTEAKNTQKQIKEIRSYGWTQTITWCSGLPQTLHSKVFGSIPQVFF